MKQLQVTMTSQQRWHNVISEALDAQLRINWYSEWFEILFDHFIGNIDESYKLESEVHLYVFGDGKASKSDRNVANSRYSLAMVQIAWQWEEYE